MKTLIIFGFIMALAFARNAPGRSAHLEFHIVESAPVKEDMNIREFEEKYGEEFANPEDEEAAAEELAKNEAAADLENTMYDEGDGHFREEINEWSDMDELEFAIEKFGRDPEESESRRYYFGRLDKDPDAANTPEELAELDRIYNEVDRQSLPKSYDARAKGYVTSVKNQGSCGSCEAFGTVAALEASLVKAGAKKAGLDISEQHAVDCGYKQNGANGCNGAQPGAYSKFYKKVKKVMHEGHYPYTAKVGTCQAKSYWNPGAYITNSHIDYQCSDEKIMKMVYKNGAVVVGVDASGNGWGQYKSGVYDTCKGKANHAVAIVGWGTEQGIPYWLIKNSWGPSWGDKGFIKVKRGTCDIGADCVFFETAYSGNADPAPKVPTACKDKYNNCADYKSLCGKNKDIINGCPKTCNTCSGGGGSKQSTCDMTKAFGKLNGEHILTFTANGKEYRAEVTCENGMCRPKNPNIPEACNYICGKGNCDHIKKQESGGGDCKDLDPSKIGCANYTDYCKHQYMVANCKKTCGNCQGGGGNCKNKNAKCPTWASYGYCKTYKNYMQKECPKACKVC